VVDPLNGTRPVSLVDLYADGGISDARRVADPHGVNVARWWSYATAFCTPGTAHGG